jgi:hypothetical protein
MGKKGTGLAGWPAGLVPYRLAAKADEATADQLRVPVEQLRELVADWEPWTFHQDGSPVYRWGDLLKALGLETAEDRRRRKARRGGQNAHPKTLERA